MKKYKFSANEQQCPLDYTNFCCRCVAEYNEELLNQEIEVEEDE